MIKKIKDYIYRAFKPKNKHEDMKIQFQLSTCVLILSLIFLVFSISKIGYSLLVLAQIFYFEPFVELFTEKGLGKFISILLSGAVVLLAFILITVGFALVFE